MKLLPIVLCAVALLGAVASASLYLRIGNTKQLLQTQLAAASSRAAALDSKLAAASEQNDLLEKRLAALDADLGEAKSRLTTTEARNIQLSRELSQTKSVLAARDDSDRALRERVASLERDLADARNSAITPATIEAYKTTIADLERQLANAQNGAAAPAVAGASTAVFATRSASVTSAASATPAGPSVVSVGPASAFVVLNYGAAHGAQTGQSLAIQRGTAVVALVLISDVRTQFSIAHVRPDTLHGALQKGDLAVLTN